MKSAKIAGRKNCGRSGTDHHSQPIFSVRIPRIGILPAGKRGVSPLIATVLLIAFAVALGAVVMNWGRGYVEETQDFASQTSRREIKCSIDITMEIIKIGGRKQICLDNQTNTVNFTLQNSGPVDIKGIRIQALSNSSSIVSNELNETFETAVPKRRYINYSYTGNGSVSQVRFTPLIEIEEKKSWCAQNVLKVEDISIC
ncbi:MAG TPA: archaellin/type IV pilin N-terminal domain-containing protein [Candidatus Nanoarchaeia archaeon]|nr:archaellin/type IV pilin N-terminal domain-containing protein [Candidatus Nanoarchaeia archaeon]